MTSRRTSAPAAGKPSVNPLPSEPEIASVFDLPELRGWQEQWIATLLSIFLLINAFVFVLASYLAWQYHDWTPMLLSGCTLCAGGLLRFWRGIAYTLKAGGICVILYSVAVFFMRRLGMHATAWLLLLLLPFLAYNFWGRLSSLLVLGGVTLTGAIFAILFLTGTLTLVTDYPTSNWMGAIASLVMAGATVVTSLDYILPRLGTTLTDARRLAEQLEQQRAQAEADMTRERRYSNWVGQAVSMGNKLSIINDRDLLGWQLVREMARVFDLYQVNLYLLDAQTDMLRLAAASGERGEHLVRDNWQIPLASRLLPGRVARSGREALAPVEPGELPQFPRSRTEACYPLVFRGELLGVLDIHGARSPFSAADMQLLGIMAGYTATLLSVLRLLEETEFQLREMRSLYAERTTASWETLLASEQVKAHTSDGALPHDDLERLAESALKSREARSALLDNQYVLLLPLVARDLPLGYVTFCRAVERGNWDRRTLELLTEAIERFALALDNTRLLMESRQRAFYEEQLGRFGDIIWGNLKVEAVMEQGVRELGRFLGAGEVSFVLTAAFDQETGAVDMDAREADEDEG